MYVAGVVDMVEALGWLSSLILLATILQQIRTQLRERSSKGVSKWLFLGQTAASAGFTTYSILVHNWVFTVTNMLLLAAGICGSLITLRSRRLQARLSAPTLAGEPTGAQTSGTGEPRRIAQCAGISSHAPPHLTAPPIRAQCRA